MKILFTAALKLELNPVKNFLFNNFSQDLINNFDFHIIGIGIKNTIKNITTYLDNKNYDFVFNIGSAGGLNPDFNIGDILYPVKFINKERNITNNIKLEIDEKYNVTPGILFTSKVPILDKIHKETIIEKYKADAVDMESFYIADLCKNHNIPFVSLKVISDLAESKSIVKFRQQLEMVIDNLYKPVYKTIKQLVVNK